MQGRGVASVAVIKSWGNGQPDGIYLYTVRPVYTTTAVFGTQTNSQTDTHAVLEHLSQPIPELCPGLIDYWSDAVCTIVTGVMTACMPGRVA